MKTFLFSLFMSAYALLQAQPKSITLLRSAFSTEIASINDDSADHALRIASYILSSASFQDSLRKLSFTSINFCDRDMRDQWGSHAKVSGSEVLHRLFAKPRVELGLLLEQQGYKPTRRSCKGLGFTYYDSQFVTSYYDNIMCSMGDSLPFTYAYGVHLCHEYVHDIGYCHYGSDADDVAEAVGEIAYYFMVKWYYDRAKPLRVL